MSCSATETISQKLPVHCLCADVNAIGGLECWSYWGDFYTLCVIYHFVTELLWFPYIHLALKLLPVDRVVCKKENISSYYSKKSKSSQNSVSSLVQSIFSQIFVNVKCMTRCLILHMWHWECKHLNSRIKKCVPVLCTCSASFTKLINAMKTLRWVWLKALWFKGVS